MHRRGGPYDRPKGRGFLAAKESLNGRPVPETGSVRAFFSNKRKNLGLCQWGNSCQYSVQMPTASTEKVRELAARLKRSQRTIWRWLAAGLDPDNERSIRAFVEAKKLRRTNVEKRRERLAAASVSNGSGSRASGREQFENLLSGELPPLGRRGAAAALERLEETEERAHARLLAAMQRGNPVQVQELQDFWLKCSETLRKLDLAVEMARRDAEEQVPKRLAEQISLYISEWLRIAFAQFLSSEARSLMGIKDVGEWKAYAIERFKGILDLTVKSSLQTKSPIPNWAADKVREAWNVSLISEA
jgi:hypothetical protein